MADKNLFKNESVVESLKVPPNSIQAEQAVLGGLMLDNEGWDKVAEHVSEEDFYRKEHRYIFRAISQLAAKMDPFDVVTVSEMLETMGEIESVGGLSVCWPRIHPRQLI